MTSYKLTYFNGRGGGEICRLIFSAAGLDFEDERLSGDDWKKRKPDMPMSALPALTIKKSAQDEGTIYCQSGTIAKFIAREHGLNGSNKEQGFLVEEVYDSVGDTLREIIRFFFEKDETKKAEAKKTLIDTVVPKFAHYFKNRKEKFGQDGYLIGSGLTLADLAVFNMIDAATLRGFGEFWKDHDVLLEHYNFIKGNPKIAKWLEKRPQTPF